MCAFAFKCNWVGFCTLSSLPTVSSISLTVSYPMLHWIHIIHELKHECKAKSFRWLKNIQWIEEWGEASVNVQRELLCFAETFLSRFISMIAFIDLIERGTYSFISADESVLYIWGINLKWSSLLYYCALKRVTHEFIKMLLKNFFLLNNNFPKLRLKCGISDVCHVGREPCFIVDTGGGCLS